MNLFDDDGHPMIAVRADLLIWWQETRPGGPMKDSACSACTPEDGGLTPSYRCAYHQALLAKARRLLERNK